MVVGFDVDMSDVLEANINVTKWLVIVNTTIKGSFIVRQNISKLKEKAGKKPNNKLRTDRLGRC